MSAPTDSPHPATAPIWPASPADEIALAPHPGAPRIRIHEGIAQLRLDRLAEHNRLDPADIDAMTLWFAQLAADPTIRALVITGTGERTFSSGYTLDAILSELDDRLERMLDALEALPFVTIAALNGSVYGGATDLALACDLRIGMAGWMWPAARVICRWACCSRWALRDSWCSPTSTPRCCATAATG